MAKESSKRHVLSSLIASMVVLPEMAGGGLRPLPMPKGKEVYWLSLGEVGFVGLKVWPLQMSTSPAGATVLRPTDPTASFRYLHVLSLDDYEVLPTEILSPGGKYLYEGRKLADVLGIVLHKSGEAQNVMAWAARHAFWKIPKWQLARLAQEELELKDASKR